MVLHNALNAIRPFNLEIWFQLPVNAPTSILIHSPPRIIRFAKRVITAASIAQPRGYLNV